MEGTVLSFLNGLTTNEILISIFLALVLILFVDVIHLLSNSTRVYRFNKGVRKLPKRVKGVFKKKTSVD